MIRHIVLFGFTGNDRAASLTRLKSTLEPLRSAIPGVASLRVDSDPHRIDGHWDAALVSEHDSWEALDAYQVHPAHIAALTAVGELTDRKAIVDYEL